MVVKEDFKQLVKKLNPRNNIPGDKTENIFYVTVFAAPEELQH